MSKKVDRAVHGPGWGEVILGAVLSLLLGVVVSAAALIAKPVAQVKELPKEEERKSGMVYYVEGARGTANPREALLKRKALAEGQSVTITEQEINAMLPVAKMAATAMAPKKEGETPEPTVADMFDVGQANFRIRDGLVQIGAPVTVNVAGFTHKLIVQVRGDVEKRGEVFAFDPEEIYIGSCPVQRIPFLSSYVERKVLSAHSIPEDIATAWRNLDDVSIEGNAVKLTAK